MALSSGNLQRDLTKGPIHLVQEQQQHHVVKQKVKPDPGDTKHSGERIIAIVFCVLFYIIEITSDLLGSCKFVGIVS